MESHDTTTKDIEIVVNGKPRVVRSAVIEGRTVILSQGWLKIATVHDEGVVEGEVIADPELAITQLKQSRLGADIFTFAQRLPDTVPRHKYVLEWDSMAAVPITTYDDWLKNRVEYDVRKAVKKAAKLGVVTKSVQLDDSLVKAISKIYNESPIRQGKRFWHYQKSLEDLKKEKATYLSRSEFIGAFLQEELIGFIKMVYVGTIATTFHVFSTQRHADKKPTNALIAKAVEICAEKGLSHLVYANYRYHRVESSLTEFKRRNGFEEVLVPRYYIPLTAKGSVFLKLQIHHGIINAFPVPLVAKLRTARDEFYPRLLRATSLPARWRKAGNGSAAV